MTGHIWAVGTRYRVAAASVGSDHTSGSDVAEMSLSGHSGDSRASDPRGAR